VINYILPLLILQQPREIAEKASATVTDLVNDSATILNAFSPLQKAFAQDGPKGIRYEFTLVYERDETGNFPSIANVSYDARFEVEGGGTFSFAETQNGDFDVASSSDDIVTFFSRQLERGESKTGTVVIDYGSDVSENTKVTIYLYVTINGVTTGVGIPVRTIIDILADGSVQGRSTVQDTGTPSSDQSSGNAGGQSGVGGGVSSGGEESGTTTGDGSGGGGGGCLIATAAFGSELSPQVQFLRDFRDGRILSTNSGSNFMNVFNSWYYSFSPHVANYERQQPWLQELTKNAIYPLLGILHLAEKAYSSIPGEFGALVAGAVTSSLIGAIYFWPFSLLFIRKNVLRKKYHVSRSDYKIAASIIAIAIIAAAIICSLVLNENTILLTITTSLFVLTILCTSAIFSAKAILRISRSVESLSCRRIVQ
jgi:peptide/nickel transport system substrate-binding protein